MNSTKANRIFLAIILNHILVVFLLIKFDSVFTLGIISNFIFSQAIVLLPALGGVFFAKENLIKLAGFHKIKISTIFMVILFTFLIMPLTTLINAISMLFVDNTVAAISGDVLETPFWIMLFIMGVFAPFCEELVFRGIIYQGYKKSGTALQALGLSALMFALMHMNFNQAAYALVIGVILILLVEATGSIWSSIIFHIVFNGWQVCLLYFTNAIAPEITSGEAQEVITTDELFMAIGIYLLIAAVTTALASGILVWIAKNEKREENLRVIWTNRKNKTGNRMVTIPLLIAIVLTLFYMSLEFIFAFLL